MYVPNSVSLPIVVVKSAPVDRRMYDKAVRLKPNPFPRLPRPPLPRVCLTARDHKTAVTGTLTGLTALVTVSSARVYGWWWRWRSATPSRARSAPLKNPAFYNTSFDIGHLWPSLSAVCGVAIFGNGGSQKHSANVGEEKSAT